MTRVVDFAAPPAERRERRLADLPGRVVAGDPLHLTEGRYESADGRLVSRTWTSTPGRWHAFTGREEFCALLSGRVRLIPGGGEAQEFGPGDAFLVPADFHGDWEVLETAAKHYVIQHLRDG